MSARAASRALPAGVAILSLIAAAASAGERSLVVRASAYNSLADQTNEKPELGAWGDRLKPGVKAIAVSRDLLPLGLRRGTKVRIEGLRGEYRVLDKMATRWRRKIDIYMGHDVEAALDWGVRRVTIRWKTPD